MLCVFNRVMTMFRYTVVVFAVLAYIWSYWAVFKDYQNESAKGANRVSSCDIVISCCDD